ncbi:MAG: 2Fe-2S iron-sulfur cluster-binding protein [Cyanobacteria bacterium J06641_5]
MRWDRDGTLALRKNHHNTIRGSCTVRINGHSALVCGEEASDRLGDRPANIEIAPLGICPPSKI